MFALLRKKEGMTTQMCTEWTYNGSEGQQNIMLVWRPQGSFMCIPYDFETVEDALWCYDTCRTQAPKQFEGWIPAVEEFLR